jgi:MscS family membrane protein
MRTHRLAIYILIFLLVFGIVATGCQTNTGSSIPFPQQASGSGYGDASSQSNPAPDGSNAQPTEEPVLETPTPAPTATPSQLDYLVEDVSRSTGINRVTVLGWNGENLINLLVSVLIVVLGILFSSLILKALTWISQHTGTWLDDRLVKIFGLTLQLLITTISLEFATARLEILSPGLKQALDIFYFSLYVLAIAIAAWRLIDIVAEGMIKQIDSPKKRTVWNAFSPLLRRLIQITIFIVGVAVVLKNAGFNLTALFAVLGLGGLALSLSAKETLEDIINGFIILVDRPYRIGDRIKVDNMDLWGDVEDIGIRTTKIRRLDNRLVVIPNSIMGNNQVENYTNNDPSYRVKLSLGIAYGSDIDKVIEILENTIVKIDGIKEEPAPQADFIDFGETAMIFQVFYWLKSYRDLRLRTSVNKAIILALEEQKIEMPFPTYDVNVEIKGRIQGKQSEQMD